MPLADFFMLSKEQILQKADKLRSEGKHAKAAELLTSGLKNSADDFDLLTALASAHLADRKGRDAVMALKNAIALVPGRAGEVLEVAERFFFTEGQLPELGDLAFEMNVSRRNFDPALKIVKSISDRDVDVLLAKYGKIKDSIDRFAGPSKPAGALAKDVAVLFTVALLLDRKGQAKQGYDLLDQILKLSPTEEDALQDCSSRMAANHPGDPEVLMRHGDVLCRTGKRDKALTLYAEAAKAGLIDQVVERLVPIAQAEEKNISIQQLLAQLYIQQQKPAEALALVKKLWQLDKRNHETYLGMMREISKLDPNSVEIHLTLGDAAVEAAKFDIALASFAKAAERAPDRLEEILGRYRQITELAPDNAEAAVRIVDAYLAAGKDDQVVKALRDMVSKDATSLDVALDKVDQLLKAKLEQPEALAFLAECYLQRQESAKASKVYLYLQTLGPKEQELALAGIQAMVSKDSAALEPMLALAQVLFRAGRIKEVGLLGAELAQRHTKEWRSFLPMLEGLSDRGDLEYNRILIDICGTIEKLAGPDRAVDFTRAEALARTEQFPAAGELFLRLSAQPDAAEAAIQALKELTGKFPQAGPLHLALAEIYQKQGQLVQMATSYLAASKVNKELIPKVTASLQELLKSSPDNAEIQLLQLDLLFQQRLLENAFKLANAIIVKWPGPEGARAYLRIGQIYLEKGELTKAAGGLLKAAELGPDVRKEAAESLLKLLDIDATSLAGHYALGKVLFFQKQYDASVEELMTVCHKEPKWAEKIISDLKAIQAADPINANVLLAEAKVNFLLRRTDDAVGALSQLMEVSPDSFDKAMAIYQQLLAREPNHPTVKMALAKAQIVRGQSDVGVRLIRDSIAQNQELIEPAITLLRQALEKEPGDIESRYLLSSLYIRRGGFEQSLEVLRSVLADKPDQIDRLITELDAILKLKPDLSQARYFMAEIYIGGRKFPQAVANLDAIHQKYPQERSQVLELLNQVLASKADQTDALLLRSRIFSEVGELEAAIEGFVKASEANPELRAQVVPELERIMDQNQNLPKAYEALGSIYFEMGKFTQARDTLTKAVPMVVDSEAKMRLLFFLAESYLALRNETKAEEAMDEVKKIMPDANEVYKALRRFSTRRLQVEIDKAYQAIQEAPDDQFKKLDLAGKLMIVEKHEAVIKLVAFKPQDEEIANRRLLLLARAFFGKNEAFTAIEVLRQVPLPQHPFTRFQMDVCYLLGQCYEAVGNYVASVSAYRNIYIDQTDYRDVKRRMDVAAEKAVLKELGHRATVLEAVATVYG